MASITNTIFVVALALALFVQASLAGKIECEDLKEESCAYAVSSTGKRCVLEKHVRRSGTEEYTCRASEIEADKIRDWIETDDCVKACGLERSALGISSDSLLESHFAKKLCSHDCYNNCANIVDLYFNLAAGEGVYLPKFCEAQGKNTRREMTEFKSLSEFGDAPAPHVPKGVGFFSGSPSLAPSPFFF